MKAGFKCQKCGLESKDVEIRQRAEGEDVVNYVHYAARICGERHCLVSPYCSCCEIDLMVPISKNGVGVEGPPLDDEDLKELKGET